MVTGYSALKGYLRARLCNCVDCSLSGFSVHGIFQARILEWVAIFLLQAGVEYGDK